MLTVNRRTDAERQIMFHTHIHTTDQGVVNTMASLQKDSLFPIC